MRYLSILLIALWFANGSFGAPQYIVRPSTANTFVQPILEYPQYQYNMIVPRQGGGGGGGESGGFWQALQKYFCSGDSTNAPVDASNAPYAPVDASNAPYAPVDATNAPIKLGFRQPAPIGYHLIRVFIPPNIDIKLPEKETEKYGPTGEIIKVDEIDKKPSKPFYFVLPPNQISQVPPYYNYYYPNTQIIQSSVFPNLIRSNIRSNSFPLIFNSNSIAQRIDSLKTKIDGSDANVKMNKSN